MACSRIFIRRRSAAPGTTRCSGRSPSPSLLLDAGFSQPQRWDWIGSAGVMDETVRCGYFPGRAGVALVRRTLLLAWHLARSNRTTARVILGMSALSAERIAATRLSDLEAVA